MRWRTPPGHGLGNGAGYNQSFKVLWGDYNDDGVVSSVDVAQVSQFTFNPGYNIFADMNGDGRANQLDVQIVQSRLGTSQN